MILFQIVLGVVLLEVWKHESTALPDISCKGYAFVFAMLAPISWAYEAVFVANYAAKMHLNIAILNWMIFALDEKEASFLSLTKKFCRHNSLYPFICFLILIGFTFVLILLSSFLVFNKYAPKNLSSRRIPWNVTCLLFFNSSIFIVTNAAENDRQKTKLYWKESKKYTYSPLGSVCHQMHNPISLKHPKIV